MLQPRKTGIYLLFPSYTKYSILYILFCIFVFFTPTVCSRSHSVSGLLHTCQFIKIILTQACLVFVLAAYGDLSSLTRGETCALCGGRVELSSLGHHGVLCFAFKLYLMVSYLGCCGSPSPCEGIVWSRQVGAALSVVLVLPRSAGSKLAVQA